MAYVQNFLHDVFISYAHNDNLADANGKCWVAEFERQLTCAIKGKFEGDSDELSIFIDKSHLHSNDEEESLKFAASHSALFLAIASPSYAYRDWPKKELQAFVDTQPDLQRLFSVERLPLSDRKKYPDPLATKTPEPFFVVNDRGTILTLNPSSKEFEEKISRLAGEICKKLHHLAEQTTQPVLVQAATTFVPGFRYDLLISHAIEDAAWVNQLCADLKKQLRRETNLDTYDGFQIAATSELGSLNDAATVLVVSSPDYCHQQNDDTYLVEAIKRKSAFRVDYLPTSDIGCLASLTPTKFWTEVTVDDKSHPMAISGAPYFATVEKLAAAVAENLKEQKKHLLFSRELKQVHLAQVNGLSNTVQPVFLYTAPEDLPLAQQIVSQFVSSNIPYTLSTELSKHKKLPNRPQAIKQAILQSHAILILYEQMPWFWVQLVLAICDDIAEEHKKEFKVKAVHMAANQLALGEQNDIEIYYCPPEEVGTYLPKFIAALS